MFIGKNQDGTFSISKSQMINEDYKWIVEDDGSNEKVYTLFKNNFKDAEHFENSLELSEPISSDDYESIELVSKTEFLNKVFDRLSNSLVHYIDGEGERYCIFRFSYSKGWLGFTERIRKGQSSAADADNREYLFP